MKHIFVVLPDLLFFCLQTTAFAAGSAADLKTIEEVERIRQLPDDQERLAAHLEPLMKNWAGAVSGNSGDFRGHFLLARAYERLGMEDMAGDEDRAADLAGGPVFGAFAL